MPAEYQIRANYDNDTIVIYQAYSHQIAEQALRYQRFVSPFSFRRMTWIKPSFRWLMYRSNWGQRNGQQKILAVRILRTGWEKALSLGILTHPEPSLFPNPAEWESQFKTAHVHIQWDTERTLRGAALNQYSIQVGISRHLIQEYVDEWIVEIEDLTPVVAKIRNEMKLRNFRRTACLVPPERVYPVDPQVGRHLLIN